MHRLALAVVLAAAQLAAHAAAPASESAELQFTADGKLVPPADYRAWPDGSLFILEVRESLPVANAANGANGYFQGEITGIEAEVKDSRFPGRWTFFNLGKGVAGAPIPATASCYSCHANNAAVENTFVQFYPALRDVARGKGTLRKVPEQF